MSYYIVGNKYPTVSEGVEALIVGKYQYDLVGIVFSGQMRFPAIWDSDGNHTFDESLSLKPRIESFSVGQYETNTGNLAVVSTIEKAQSSYPLVGYVSDAYGRLYIERWTLQGNAFSNHNNNLNRFA